MNESSKGVPNLPLLLICLLGSSWALNPSKFTVLETQVKRSRDSVYFRNPTSHPIRIHVIEVKLDPRFFPNWELSVRASHPPGEICFGQGIGVCPPANPMGGFQAGWTVPAMDSLLLYDFNLANCLRCPLEGAPASGAEDSLSVPLTFMSEDSKVTLKLSARLVDPSRGSR